MITKTFFDHLQCQKQNPCLYFHAGIASLFAPVGLGLISFTVFAIVVCCATDSTTKGINIFNWIYHIIVFKNLILQIILKRGPSISLLFCTLISDFKNWGLFQNPRKYQLPPSKVRFIYTFWSSFPFNSSWLTTLVDPTFWNPVELFVFKSVHNHF